VVAFPSRGVGSIPTRVLVLCLNGVVYNLANCIMHHICSGGLASHHCVISPALLQPAMFFCFVTVSPNRMQLDHQLFIPGSISIVRYVSLCKLHTIDIIERAVSMTVSATTCVTDCTRLLRVDKSYEVNTYCYGVVDVQVV
jgi:hypothetical protein